VRKVEKLSQQFFLASWHSRSTGENLEAFSAAHFISEGITTKFNYKTSHKKAFLAFSTGALMLELKCF